MRSLTHARPGGARPPAWLRFSSAGVVYALGLLVAALTLVSALRDRPFYLDPDNLSNILDQTALIGLVAVSTTVVLISGNFDLSVGSTAALGAAVCLSLAPVVGAPAAVLVAVLAGVLIGLLNGVVVQYVGINAFIVTLGTMTAVRGLVLIMTGGRTITVDDAAARDGLRALDAGSWITPNLVLVGGLALAAFGLARLARAWRSPGGWRRPSVLLPLAVGAALVAGSPAAISTLRITQRSAYMLVFAAVVAWVLHATTIGRRLYATGGNTEAARLSGIHTDRYKVAAFVLNGATAAFVGVVFASRLGSINPNGLSGMELTALAAAILGGTSLFGGLGSVAKSIVGALILFSLRNGFNVLNLGANWQGLIEGVVLVIAAGAYTVSAKRQRTRTVRDPGPGGSAAAPGDPPSRGQALPAAEPTTARGAP